MPAGSNYRSLSSFTCLPPKAFTIHLLLSRPYSRVATEPLSDSGLSIGAEGDPPHRSRCAAGPPGRIPNTTPRVAGDMNGARAM